MPTLLPLDIPPGVVKSDSPNATKGRYSDSDKVRFIKGRPEKWGGWISFIGTALSGVPRGANSWTTATGNQNIAVGTHTKLYVITGGDTLTNITPIRDSGTLGNDPFAVVDTSTTVTVTDASHGLEEGATVRFSGATAGGGITINGSYIVTEVVNANSYKIEHSSPATATDSTTGGANVAYEYEINIGNQHPGFGTGWGMGAWSHDTGWGEEITSGGLPEDMRHWSLSAYGHNLLACPFAGTLYDWEEGTDDQAQIITNAPDYIRSMFVTPERFVFALGTDNGSNNDPMRLQWPDQDDITDWTPTSANTANSRTLQHGSKIMHGCALKDLLSLVWTDTSLYVFQYTVGSDFIYEDRLAGENCGLVGPLAFVNVDGVAYWMSAQGFHMFSGAVNDIPNNEDVASYVFGRMKSGHGIKTYCQYMAEAGTIVWFYTSEDSDDLEPDSYVEVQLEDFSWTVGSLNRTCGCIFRPHEGTVVMFDQDGASFEHENGTDAAGFALNAYISFGEYQLQEGMQNVDIIGLVPDFQRQTGRVSFEVYTKDRPQSPDHFDEDTLEIEEGDEIAACRISGRVFGMTVRSNQVSGDFRLGIPTLEIQDAGERR